MVAAGIRCPRRNFCGRCCKFLTSVASSAARSAGGGNCDFEGAAAGADDVDAGSGGHLLAETVAQIIGYKGVIRLDSSKPNGTPRKLLDVSKAKALGWTYTTELADGIRLAYADFLSNPVRAER